jgi:Histidine kinase-, DNA gyrase B-, and HSP90-like ATPase
LFEIMLRTFCSNPALGGFGSESTITHSNNDTQETVTPDAFCQIIKELVDNAVDACNVATGRGEGEFNPKNINSNNGKERRQTKAATEGAISVAPAKRVRVVIERFTDHRLQSLSSNDDKQELLRVTVSDNGCGMTDIQTCVGAFQSSKAHNASQKSANTATTASKLSCKSSDSPTTSATQTVGRYGIGLTLCLLHAQRLVPDSCASIQSATSEDTQWNVVLAVVDTASDTVRCFPRDGTSKSNPSESGTAISILVPVRSFP